MAEWQVTAGVELILGGQKSGKSRRAELLAAAWLAGAGEGGDGGTDQPLRQATLIATAQAWDGEMHQRIARHQVDRAQRVPGLATVEEPLALADTIRSLSAPHHLLVVDCLTLWLTALLMPMAATVEQVEPLATENVEPNHPVALDSKALSATHIDNLLNALRSAPGPVVLVGNEIGLGVIPLGAEVRRFVDELGLLNQRVGDVAQRVVLMVAGRALVIKQEQTVD
jgi:adenosylcobinamide kinase/adenosylcobinamide-phosphate guanylyltransferase